jgi:hypothetical protein
MQRTRQFQNLSSKEVKDSRSVDGSLSADTPVFLRAHFQVPMDAAKGEFKERSKKKTVHTTNGATPPISGVP